MNKDVRNPVINCFNFICAKRKVASTCPAPPIPVAEYIWKRMANMDIVAENLKGNISKILVLMEYVKRFFITIFIKDQTAETIAKQNYETCDQ